MKLPQSFRPEKDLDDKINKLLRGEKISRYETIDHYPRIRYTHSGHQYILDWSRIWKGTAPNDYIIPSWKLSEKEFYELKWYDCYDQLDRTAVEVLEEVLQPVKDFLNLNGKISDMRKVSCISLLEDYAKRVGDFYLDKPTYYKKDSMIIVMNTHEKLDLGDVIKR
ncbi:MAG: hypothetical protein KKA79_08635 [Nanoarchaeota archaeon]|nr:hypothetical protein [Nanoarchaeota archaeon]